MMRKLRLISSALLLAASLFLAGFTFAIDQQRYRIGAICKDGWQSSATGRGACSHHGGVMCWLYSDGTCTKP